MNKDHNNKFTWGETVKVKDTAPSIFRPGEIVSICGFHKIKSLETAEQFVCYVGEWVYTIEFLGGTDIEIPERYLEESP